MYCGVGQQQAIEKDGLGVHWMRSPSILRGHHLTETVAHQAKCLSEVAAHSFWPLDHGSFVIEPPEVLAVLHMDTFLHGSGPEICYESVQDRKVITKAQSTIHFLRTCRGDVEELEAPFQCLPLPVVKSMVEGE